MYDVVCFSHLRWDFVFQRPQHLLRRAARSRQVLYVEEAIPTDGDSLLTWRPTAEGVDVLTPMIDRSLDPREAEAVQASLVQSALAENGWERYVLWFYTPMALPLATQLAPLAVVYDCMDELRAFKGAPPELLEREATLLGRTDVVFTGGHSLYEAKRDRHPNVYSFPSSVDVAHFSLARREGTDPHDQAAIPSPRLGFSGVIDERMDLSLLRDVARARPDWNFVMLGPVTKVDPADLPRGKNIHYLGPKKYDELPSYIRGWDVALLPFARNEATRFISPTKTPEYLAAGKPVVSTSIEDVVRTYGDAGLCFIADEPDGLIDACERALLDEGRELRLQQADEFLSHISWDDTWRRMEAILDLAIASNGARTSARTAVRSRSAEDSTSAE